MKLKLICVRSLSLLVFLLGCDDKPLSDLPIAVFDKEGNQYSTTKIGDQVWLRENLRTTLYNNGDPIETTATANVNISGVTNPKYQWLYFNGADPVGAGIGLLYTWHSIMDNRGICPPGFRVPSEEDWTQLATFLGGTGSAGGKLKQIGTGLWNPPNTGATNEAKFNGIPAGSRIAEGSFSGLGTTGLHWTSTTINSETVIAFTLSNQSSVLASSIQNKKSGLSCRCIKI